MGKRSRLKHHQLNTKTDNSSATDKQSVEFIKHVHEFRNRIFWVVLLFMVASTLAYQYRDILIRLVLSPLGSQKLMFLTPAGGFSFIFQITMYAGAVVAAPVLVFQLYKFVTPALPVRARQHAAMVFLASFLLMCSGVAFGYLVAVPSALHFLTTFAGNYINANLTADSYLSFIIAYSFGLGALFQLPLFLIFWHWIKPLTLKQLMNSERYMIVVVMIAAAVITPTPDPVNQMIIAGPILIVYQIGVVAVLLMIKGARKRKAKQPNILESFANGRAQGINLSSLVLPSAEDLAPRRPVVVQKSVRPAVNIQKSSVVAPILSLKTHAAAPAVAVRPSLNSISHPRVAGREVVNRPRPVVASRPLPQASRPRVASMDGFVVPS